MISSSMQPAPGRRARDLQLPADWSQDGYYRLKVVDGIPHVHHLLSGTTAPLPEALAKSVPDPAHLKITMNFSELRACVHGADNFWPIPCCKVLGTSAMPAAGSDGQAIAEPPGKKRKALPIMDGKPKTAVLALPPSPAANSHGADEAAGSAPATPCSDAAASEDEAGNPKGGAMTLVDEMAFEPPLP